nr:PREDICTED: protein GAPT [Latimeria chalumnae]|eukprot:XP_014344882.1 PREDICTED: protein GAPT [Latimeria chalumnae]
MPRTFFLLLSCSVQFYIGFCAHSCIRTTCKTNFFRDVECLMCDECNKTIEWGVFPDSITHLYLNSCKIDQISFEKAHSKVEVVNLSDNNLTSLPEGSFNDLQNLKKLYLEKNRLKQLPKSLFRNTVQLTVDCDCELLNSIDQQNKTPAPNVRCVHTSSSKVDNFSDYYNSCHSNLTTVIVCIALILLLIICGLGIWWWKHTHPNSSALQGILRRKRDQTNYDTAPFQSQIPLTGVNLQPRPHTSAVVISDSCQSSSHKNSNQLHINSGNRNYENMSIGPLNSNKRFMENKSDVYEKTDEIKTEDPIYVNDPSSIYFNYVGPTSPKDEEEDIYIIAST